MQNLDIFEIKTEERKRGYVVINHVERSCEVRLGCTYAKLNLAEIRALTRVFEAVEEEITARLPEAKDFEPKDYPDGEWGRHCIHNGEA